MKTIFNQLIKLFKSIFLILFFVFFNSFLFFFAFLVFSAIFLFFFSNILINRSTQRAQTSAERQFFPDPDRGPERTPGSG